MDQLSARLDEVHTVEAGRLTIVEILDAIPGAFERHQGLGHPPGHPCEHMLSSAILKQGIVCLS